MHLANANDLVKSTFSSKTQHFPGIQKAYHLSTHITGLGAPYFVIKHAYELLCISRVFGNRHIAKAIGFNRFIVNGMLYHTQEYSANVRRNDFIVCLSDNSVLRVEKFMLVYFDGCECNEEVCTCKEIPVVIGTKLVLKLPQPRVYDQDVQVNLASAYSTRVASSSKVAIEAKSIDGKCLLLSNCGKDLYIPWRSNEYTD